MKLTEKQKDALQLLNEEKSISINDNRCNKNVMNALYFKNLVTLTNCINGKFWKLTDDGLNSKNQIK